MTESERNNLLQKINEKRKQREAIKSVIAYDNKKRAASYTGTLKEMQDQYIKDNEDDYIYKKLIEIKRRKEKEEEEKAKKEYEKEERQASYSQAFQGVPSSRFANTNNNIQIPQINDISTEEKEEPAKNFVISTDVPHGAELNAKPTVLSDRLKEYKKIKSASERQEEIKEALKDAEPQTVELPAEKKTNFISETFGNEETSKINRISPSSSYAGMQSARAELSRIIRDYGVNLDSLTDEDIKNIAKKEDMSDEELYNLVDKALGNDQKRRNYNPTDYKEKQEMNGFKYIFKNFANGWDQNFASVRDEINATKNSAEVFWKSLFDQSAFGLSSEVVSSYYDNLSQEEKEGMLNPILSTLPYHAIAMAIKGINNSASKAKKYKFDFITSGGTESDKIAKEIKNLKETTSVDGITRFVGDVAESIGFQAPTWLIRKATFGLLDMAGASADLSKTIANIISGLYIGTSSSNRAMKEAFENGATVEQAMAMGVAQGLIDGAGEYLIGGFLGTDALTGTIGETILSHLKSPTVKHLVKLFASAAGEGTEEIIQYGLSVGAQKVIYDPDAKFDFKEAAYSGLMGATVGGIFNLPGFIDVTLFSSDIDKNLKNSYDPEELYTKMTEVYSLEQKARYASNQVKNSSGISENENTVTYNVYDYMADKLHEVLENVKRDPSAYVKNKTVQYESDYVNTDSDATIRNEADSASGSDAKKSVTGIDVTKIDPETAVNNVETSDVPEDFKKIALEHYMDSIRNSTLDKKAKKYAVDMAVRAVKKIESEKASNAVRSNGMMTPSVETTQSQETKPSAETIPSDETTVSTESTATPVKTPSSEMTQTPVKTQSVETAPSVETTPSPEMTSSSEAIPSDENAVAVQSAEERKDAVRNDNSKTLEQKKAEIDAIDKEESVKNAKETFVPNPSIITKSGDQYLVKPTQYVGSKFQRYKKAMTDAGGTYSKEKGGFLFSFNPASILSGDIVDATSDHVPDGNMSVSLDEADFKIYNNNGTYIVSASQYLGKKYFERVREKLGKLGGVYSPSARGFEFNYDPTPYLSGRVTSETQPSSSPQQNETRTEMQSSSSVFPAGNAVTDDAIGNVTSSEQNSSVGTVHEVQSNASDIMTEDKENSTDVDSAISDKSSGMQNNVSEIQSEVNALPNQEYDKTGDIIPETSGTEQAKRELIRDQDDKLSKNGVRIADSLKSGTLTSDNISFTSSVPGFSDEQRNTLAKELIDGLSTDADTIHVSVPYDGTFDVKNSLSAVSNMLDSLKVKGDTSSMTSAEREFAQYMAKAVNVSLLEYNNQKFMTDRSYFIIRSSDALEAEVSRMRGADSPIQKSDPSTWQTLMNLIYRSEKIPVSRFAYVRDTKKSRKEVAVFADGDSIGKESTHYFYDESYLSKFMKVSGDSDLSIMNDSRIHALVSFDENGLVACITRNNTKDDIFSEDGSFKEGVVPYKKGYFTTNPKKKSSVNKSKNDTSETLKPDDSENNVTSPDTVNDSSNIPDTVDNIKKETQVRKDENNGQSVLGRENQNDDSGLQSKDVPQGEKGRNSEGTDIEDGGAGGKTVSGKSELADGTQHGGNDVRNEEPDTKSDIVSGVDESAHGKGNGGRDDSESSSRRRLNTKNYSFSEESKNYIDDKRPNASDNLAAIETLKLIESEGREATAGEKEALMKYKGWGGLAGTFSVGNPYYRRLNELLTPDEMAAAKSTVNNAHYTSTKVIDAIYKGLDRMGFKGGNVLEPSMGVGNFFGSMPKKLSEKSNLYGVEMDSITGRIAQALYPEAQISIKQYQDVQYKDGSFDAAIGNVPFLNVYFPYKGGKYMLHDYFFVKTLDKVKDGGVVAMLTSTGTLDKNDAKARAAIAERADLIAAFRLPQDAFKTNAGTQVTTDLLIFRKRPEGVLQSNETFLDIKELNGIPINEYYVRHPQNILGELVYEKGMYANERAQVKPDGDVEERLNEAILTLPKNILKTDMTSQPPVVQNEEGKPKFVSKDGSVYFSSGDGTTEKITGKPAKVVSDYINVRDSYNNLLEVLKNQDSTDVQKETARDALNGLYDIFVANNGAINDMKNKRILGKDNDYFKVTGLEVKGSQKGTFKKSDIFSVDTIGRKKATHANSASDALSISLTEKGKVDIPYMMELTKRSAERIISDLNGAIIETPDGEYMLTEMYLSGNIREKISEAEKAAKEDSKYQKNVDALKAVMPKQSTPDKISPSLGAAWIPSNVYEQFAREVLGARYGVSIFYDKIQGTWNVESRFMSSVKYSSGYSNLPHLLESTMNMKSITVRKDGIVDISETQKVRALQESLKQDFIDWVFKDKDRRDELTEIYNVKFNSWRNMDYNKVGEYLDLGNFPGEFTPRDYQKGAVARVLFSGNTLLAHGVGTGKTAEMIMSAMESKRIGLTHKNLFVVPNNKVSDFRNDVISLYPDAKVLMATEMSFKPENRARLFAQIATNDIDIVIIGHSQFTMIPVSVETQKRFIEDELQEIENELTEYNENRGNNKSKTSVIKRIEKTKLILKAKLASLLKTKKDNTINFEDLGIDGLFVDEAHNFKNLYYFTKLDVAGAASGNAKRSEDMYMKTRYLHSKGNLVVFATATPVTNSISELYTMSRYVSPETLDEAGLSSFDAWASSFGNIGTKVEISPDGVSFRVKERFANFKNVQAMVGLTRQFASVLNTEDVVKGLPAAEYITVECESNDIQEKYLKNIQNRINHMSGRGGDASDNMLLVTNDGRAMATDCRLIAKQLNMDTDLLDFPGSKINQTVNNVVKEYKNSASIKGTQLIFLDYGMKNDPNARYGFDLYTDLKNKLVSEGIPENEIARIDNYKTVIAKEELYEKVRNGEIRVLIGSTARMGEGMNVQNRLVALHHLNAPYRPADIKQREGRIVRFGNQNKNVRIYRYIQKKSFDSYMWQMLERKAIAINQAMSGGDIDTIDDIDEFVLSAGEAKAIASGNPLLMRKMELDNMLYDLKAQKANHDQIIWNAQETIAKMPTAIEADKEVIANIETDVNTLKRHPAPSEGVEIKVKGKTYTTHKEAGKAILSAINTGKHEFGIVYEIGSIRGLQIKFKLAEGGRMLYLDGAYRYEIPASDSDIGNVTRILNAIENYPKHLNARKNILEDHEKRLSDAKKIVNEPFKNQEELDSVNRELSDIMTKMNLNANAAADEIIDDTGMHGNFKTENEIIDDEEDNEDEYIMSPEDDIFSESYRDDGASEMRYMRNESSGQNQTGSNRSKEKVNPKIRAWSTNNTNSIPTITDLVMAVKDLFGIEINAGRFRARRNTRGIFKRNSNTIRVRDMADIQTISHELGHYFDKSYHILGNVPSEAMDEITELYGDNLSQEYNDDQIPGEVVAEYFRNYLTNRSETVASAPLFTEYLFNTLNANDEQALNVYATLVDRHMSASRSQRYANTIVSKKKRKFTLDSTKKSLVKAKRFGIQMFFNRFATFRDMEKNVSNGRNVTEAISLLNDINTIAASNIDNDTGYAVGLDYDPILIMTEDGGQKKLPTLMGVLSKYFKSDDGGDANAYMLYHKLKRALTLHERGIRTFAENDLQNPENIRQEINGMLLERPWLDDAVNEVVEWQNAIANEFLVGSGIISRSDFNDMVEKDPFYVPFFRVIDVDYATGKGAGGKGISDVHSPIRRIKGSGLDTKDIISNIALNATNMIKAGLRNYSGNSLADLVDSNPSAASVWMEQVDPKTHPEMISTFGIQKTMTDFLSDGENVSIYGVSDPDGLADALSEAIGYNLLTWRVNDFQGKTIVSFMRDGQPVYYEVHEPSLLSAIKVLSPKQMNDVFQAINGLLNTFGIVTNAKKTLTTGINPVWQLRNVMKDFFPAYIKSTTTNNPFAYVKDFLTSFADILKRSDIYREYSAVSGYVGRYTEGSSKFDKTIGKIKKSSGINEKQNNVKKAFTFVGNLVKATARLFSSLDDVTRLAEYKRTREKGGSKRSAVYNAHKVAVNFSEKGVISAELDKLIPYFGAAMTSNHQNFMAYLDNPDFNGKNTSKASIVKQLGISMLKAAIQFLQLGLIAMLLGKDELEEAEESYIDTSSYHKNNSSLFYAGDGKWTRIPKSESMDLLTSLIERTVERYILGNADAFYNFDDYMTKLFIPSLDITILGTLMELQTNESWSGRDIVPPNLYNKSLPLQFNENTSKISCDISRLMSGIGVDISPIQMEYFLDQNTGEAFNILTAIYEAVKSGDPGKVLSFAKDYMSSVFSADSVYSTDIVSKMYESKEKYEKLCNSFKETNGADKRYTSNDAYMYNKYNKYASMYSGCNTDIKQEQDEENARAMRNQLNSIIDIMNRNDKTAIDKEVMDIISQAGIVSTEIINAVSPYVSIPDSVTYKAKNENGKIMEQEKYELGFNDRLIYFRACNAALEDYYSEILETAESQGWDPNYTIDVLTDVRSEIQKGMKEDIANYIHNQSMIGMTSSAG